MKNNGPIYQMVSKFISIFIGGISLDAAKSLLIEIEKLETTWIPVEERLPTDADNVLVVSVAYYQLGSWWEAHTHKRLEGVTHFQHLPQPQTK